MLAYASIVLIITRAISQTREKPVTFSKAQAHCPVGSPKGRVGSEKFLGYVSLSSVSIAERAMRRALYWTLGKIADLASAIAVRLYRIVETAYYRRSGAERLTKRVLAISYLHTGIIPFRFKNASASCSVLRLRKS